MRDNFADGYRIYIGRLVNKAAALIPGNFSEFEHKYIIDSIKEYTTVTAEFLIHNERTDEDYALSLTQIIAEWTYYICIDLVNSCIPHEYWGFVLQKTNFMAFESYKIGTKKSCNPDTIFTLIDTKVKEGYSKAILELYSKGLIDKITKEIALSQSNVDFVTKNLNLLIEEPYDNLSKTRKAVIFSFFILALAFILAESIIY